jgi:hypothetical protein
MALYELHGICQEHKNSGAGFIQQFTVEAPDKERAEAKFEARILNKHPLVNYVHIDWVEEVESKSSNSSSFDSSSSVLGTTGWLLGKAFGGERKEVIQPKKGTKAYKDQQEGYRVVYMICGAFVASPFVLAFLMMTWEILLPVSLLAGGGYYFNKKNNK